MKKLTQKQIDALLAVVRSGGTLSDEDRTALAFNGGVKQATGAEKAAYRKFCRHNDACKACAAGRGAGNGKGDEEGDRLCPTAWRLYQASRGVEVSL